MTRVALCLSPEQAQVLAADLERLGAQVRAVAPGALVDADLLHGADILVIPADTRILTPALLAVCDRARVRIVPIATGERATAFARGHGLHPVSAPDARAILAAAATIPAEPRPVPRGGVTVVWGAHGAPGRSTVAASLAVESARHGRVVLIDADTHAPSLALLLGLTDDGPGLAGACRQVARAALDAAEFSRIAQPLPGTEGAVHVLVGLNRPERWPELRAERLTAVLTAVRDWADHIVVDVAAPVEADEHLLSDVEGGPRRNAATIAALACADRVVAVTQADPVSIARFLRAQPDLRRLAPQAEVLIAANRLRPGAVGIDPRGQLRRTLERFGDPADLCFLADDPAAADRAMLHARPVSVIAPRSALAVSIRRLAERCGAPTSARVAGRSAGEQPQQTRRRRRARPVSPA